MLRICLIVAIVMGLATLAVSQFRVDAKIKETREQLTQTEESLQKSQADAAAARSQAKKDKKEAEDAKKELEEAKTSLEETTAKADTQERRANDLESKLNDMTRSRNDAQAKLAEWEAFGVTPARVREVLDQNKKLVADNEALGKENQVLDREVLRVKNRLQIYEGEKLKVELPSGLKGKVVAVDPKYDFVVLDIGQDDGVLERGEMLVNRGGKLVARVRIMSVQSKRSVANVLVEWKQADVMEGDQVVVGL